MNIRHAAEVCKHSLLLLMLTAAIPALAQQESIVIDPATGDYTITYQGLDLDGNPKWHQVVYVPATKIESEVKSKFRVSDKRGFTYNYRIRNYSQSKQAVRGFSMYPSHVDSTTEITPKGWWAMFTPDFNESGQESGFIAGWSFETSDSYAGLSAGKSQAGFGFESSYLPGIGVARLRGAVGVLNGFPDEGPGDDNPIYPEYRKFMREDYVPRFVAVPKIPAPTPFNAVVVLGGIQKHVKDDMASMQLIDPPLLILIDRGLTQAIVAAQGGNSSSLLHEIKNLRQFLKQEHADVDKDDDSDDDDKEKKPKPRITKLAAKVLDFDLKYVEKRVKGDKD